MFTRQKNQQKDSILYVALGDSLTEGIGVHECLDSHWARQAFRKLCFSKACRLRNLGVSGLTSTELLELVSTTAVSKLLSRATHISITTGGCDFIALYNEFGVDKLGVLKGKLLAKMDEVCDRTYKILTHVRELNEKSKLYLFGFYVPLPAYSVDLDLAAVTIQSMNSYYKNMCGKFSSIFIDPFNSFLEKKEYFYDDIHPNKAGHNKLAELIMQVL